MQGRNLVVFLFTFILTTGCGLTGFRSKEKAPEFETTDISQGNSQQSQKTDPAEKYFKYAYSGIIFNDSTDQPITNFSIDLITEDPAISSVINALGNLEGLFHISRNPEGNQPIENEVPVLISAPGFESIIKKISLGYDCQTANCLGTLPNRFLLKPELDVASLDPLVSAITLLAKSVDESISSQGALTIFNDLLQKGKIDSQLQNLLSSSNNGDQLTNILVLLNGAVGDSANAAELVSSILANISDVSVDNLVSKLPILRDKGFNSFSPLLAGTSPDLSSALVSANMLIPYLKPIIDQAVAKNPSPALKVLQGLLDDPNVANNIVKLADELKKIKAGETSSAQFASAGFLPFLGDLASGFSQNQPTAIAYDDILTNSLRNKALADVLKKREQDLAAAANDPDELLKIQKRIWFANLMQTIGPMIQPLIQGLLTKQAPALAPLLNQVGSQSNPAQLAANFLEQGGANQFAKILPYLEPVISGLSGEQQAALSAFLTPFLKKEDPSKTFQNFFSEQNGNLAQLAEAASALFPGLTEVLNQKVPSKQVFTAQLIQGLLDGSFKNLSVVKELQGASAIVISGRARDIFKIAQLPNVQKVIALEP